MESVGAIAAENGRVEKFDGAASSSPRTVIGASRSISRGVPRSFAARRLRCNR